MPGIVGDMKRKKQFASCRLPLCMTLYWKELSDTISVIKVGRRSIVYVVSDF